VVYHHLLLLLLFTYSVVFSFPQIDCISLLSEANPRAQQTHISSAQMMNLYMKSKFLTDHVKFCSYLIVSFHGKWWLYGPFLSQAFMQILDPSIWQCCTDIAANWTKN